METKKQIRRKMLEKRAAHPLEFRREADTAICNLLCDSSSFCRSEEIYCYVSKQEEVSTKIIIEEAFARGKSVAVPKVLGPHRMEFYYIKSLDELKQGYKGILEPSADREAKGERGLAIVPGVAYDCLGNRIGYGGGFYDSYLQAHPFLDTIGLFYSVQGVEKLPCDEGDIQLQMIITEKGKIIC